MERTGLVGVNAGTLFSGVGALDLGLEWAGFDVRWGCEIDPWCNAIWRERFGRPCYSDARDLPADAEPVDLLAGGFPCQPVSLAGRGLAQDDPRWLWPAFERAIRLLRPRLVFVENVLGLVNRGMADVLGGLAALGFDAAWTVFGAAHVGAPHLRRRLWIVAAHPGRIDLRIEPGRIFGPGWADQALAGLDGASLALADANGAGLGKQRRAVAERAQHAPAERGGWWASEPEVGRVAHGVPARVDRLRALGNGVVPQCAELVGRRLMQAVAA